MSAHVPTLEPREYARQIREGHTLSELLARRPELADMTPSAVVGAFVVAGAVAGA